jgi:hypothetical protein
MIEANYTKVQNDFIENMFELNDSSIKVYFALRKCVNESRNDGNEVWPSYDWIQKVTGIKKRDTIKDALIELTKQGWISNIKKGFSSVTHYFLPDERIKNPDDEVIEIISKRWKKKPKNTILMDAEITNMSNQVTYDVQSTVHMDVHSGDSNNTNLNKLNENKLNFKENNFSNLEEEISTSNLDNLPFSGGERTPLPQAARAARSYDNLENSIQEVDNPTLNKDNLASSKELIKPDSYKDLDFLRDNFNLESFDSAETKSFYERVKSRIGDIFSGMSIYYYKPESGENLNQYLFRLASDYCPDVIEPNLIGMNF